MDPDDKIQLIQQEENAIKNQIILFINRIINMKTPIEFAGSDLLSLSNMCTLYCMTIVQTETRRVDLLIN